MPTWMTRALCAVFPTLPWLAEPEDRSAAAERSLRTVCSLCPVASDCAAYVGRRHITSGYWASADRTPNEPQSSSGAA